MKYSEKNRIDFNWGFWDARDDKEQNRPQKWNSPKEHYNPFYYNGYVMGYKSDSNVQLSTAAWKEFVKNENMRGEK